MENIKVEKVFRTELRQGKRMEETRFQYSEKHFDENKNLIMSKITDPNGVLTEKYIMKYNEKGQPVEREYYVEDDNWSEKSKSEYDENGRLIKEIITYMDGSESVTTFKYENDKIVSVITVDTDDDEVIESTQRQFNAEGKLLKEEKFEYGELVSVEENTYDNNGNLTHRKIYDAKDEKYTEEIFVTDGDKVLSYTKTFPDGRTEEYKNIFDESGKVIRVDHSGEYKSHSEIKYTPDGLIEEEIEVLENKTVLYHIKRKYEDGRLIEASHFYNRLGQAPNVEYVLDYVYE